MNRRLILRLAALLGAASVALGAFGAHGLQAIVSADRVVIFETGVRYAFYHTFALGLAGAVYEQAYMHVARLGTAVWLWLAGVLLFSGSLFLLAFRDIAPVPVSVLGPITPVGGLLLIAGWFTLFFSVKSNTP